MNPTTRYAAFLRGVMPTNCRMPALKACFESAGFGNVRTLLSSGNVVFDAPTADLHTIEQQAEEAMLASMGQIFPTLVRSAAYLQDIVARDPFSAFALPAAAKRIVTFRRVADAPSLQLPVEQDGAHILLCDRTEVYAAYEPSPKGVVFMTLLERTFGKDITTRTLGTVAKCAVA